MSTNTSNKLAGSTSRISLLNLFLLFIAALQGSSQLLGLFFSPESILEPSLLKVWLSLGIDMSKNWVAISILLIALVLGCHLYNILSLKSSSPRNRLMSIALLLVNLVLCLRVYSTSSFFDKIAYLTANLPTVIIVSIIVLFVVAIILVIQKERKNTKELEELLQGEVNKSGNEALPTGDSTDTGRPTTDMRCDPETVFRLEHPFSYAYRSFVKDLGKKQKIKREHKEKMLQIKANTEEQKKNTELKNLQEKGYIPENKAENIVGYISVLLAFLICIALVIFLFTQNGKGGSLIIIQQITNYILDITGILDDAKGPLTNFLLSSGILFLFVILILTFFLLVYITLRVVAYLFTHPAEDTARVHRIGKAIKTFVLGLLDGALRPLLFLPDFLECVEDMLLDTDMDEKIDKIYPPVNLSSELTEANAPEEDRAEQTDSPEPSEQTDPPEVLE